VALWVDCQCTSGHGQTQPRPLPGVDSESHVPPGRADLLASASAEERRRIIGDSERLYYSLIHITQPALAGKITGMLREGLDTSELLHFKLTKSPESLALCITEAIEVLEMHKRQVEESCRRTRRGGCSATRPLQCQWAGGRCQWGPPRAESLPVPPSSCARV
jgi:hypothetical protein